MAKINYIASAGTGKTYNLVKEVIKKLEGGYSLRDFLILTFTNKAAFEMIDRLSSEIYKKPKIYNEILNINSGGNIGTFHSVFFGILKKYPEYTHVDSSTGILITDKHIFLEKVLEEWSQEDIKKNKKDWIKIANLIDAKNFKKVFFSLYENRLRLEKEERKNIDIEETKNRLREYIHEVISILEPIEKKEKINYRVSPWLLLNLIKENRLIQIPDEKPSTKGLKSFLLKENCCKNKKIKELLKEDESFKRLDEKIYLLSKDLRKKAFIYNYRFLIRKFYQFLDYVNKKKKEENLIDFNDILEKTRDLLKKDEIKDQIQKKYRYIFVDEFQDTDILQLEILNNISNGNLYVFGDPKQCIYEWRDADLQYYFSFLQDFEKKILNKNRRSFRKIVSFINGYTENYLSHIPEDYKRPVEPHHSKDGEVKIFYIEGEESREKSIENEALATVYIINNLLEQGYKYSDISILFRTNSNMKKFATVLTKAGIPVEISSDSNLFENEEVKFFIDILKLSINREDNLSLIKILKSPVFMVEDKEIYQKKDNLLSISPELNNFLDMILETETLEEALNKLIENTEFVETYTLIKGKQVYENIKILKNLLKGFDEDGLGIYDFIRYSSEATFPTSSSEEGEGVNLLTIHTSKGLENKIIIIPLVSYTPDNQTLKIREVNIYDGKVAVNLPYIKNENFFQYQEDISKKIENEEERLFYVAITRAKEKLYFIQTDPQKKSKKDIIYSNILKKLREYIQIEKIKDIKAENISLEQKKKPVVFKDIRKIEEKLNNKYNKAFKKKQFSVSELMNNKEFEKEKDIYAYIGTIVHQVLEKIDLKNYSLEKAEKILGEILNRTFHPEKNIIKKEVIYFLKVFENSDILKEIKTSSILAKELPFSLKEEKEDFVVNGKIDIIYEKKDKIVVMDFKTNRYNGNIEKDKIKNMYLKQKEYYTKAVKKLFPDREIVFALGLLWKGEILYI